MTLDKDGIAINGRREILLCASFFYFRIPRAEWAARAKLIAGLGYNSVDVYFPWNFHEGEPGGFDFAGDKDVEAFLRICAEHNLYVVARPGPYICSEWDGGGLPAWVIANREIRQNDAAYLAEVEKWYARILPLVARHQLGGAAGGSVVLVQLENELDFFDCADPEGYMGSLRAMARAQGITVPLFACAGQGDIRRSGGLTPGVLPTYNFYPKLDDATFDYNLARYSRTMRAKGLPFLITETDRKHSVLKRELLAGGKLLGAYNQVGGSNFGYYQSVNNWGEPLSLICTLYDFDGMIDNLGHCTPEADEALLFSHLLRLYGSGLAAGRPAQAAPELALQDEAVACTNAVDLAQDGGQLVCVRSVAAQPKTVQAGFAGHSFALALEGYGALALPHGLKLAAGKIAFANCEVFSLSPLVFIRAGAPFVLLEQDGRQTAITEGGCYGGLEVRFISKEEAVARIKQQRGLALRYVRETPPKPVESCLAGVYVNPAPFAPAPSPLFAANGIWQGEAEYRIESGGRPLFLQGISDFLTVKNGGEVVFAGLCSGGDVFAPGGGEVTATVEQWGHCNFDDPGTKSLRIKSERGIENIYGLIDKTELTHWQFTEVDEFSPAVEITQAETDPRISLNSWNSTRQPLMAAYYGTFFAGLEAGEELLLRLEGQQAECLLFINGRFACQFRTSAPSVNITRLVRPNEENHVALCVRKPIWTVQTGRLYLLRAAPCAFKLRRVNHLAVYEAAMQPARLPLALAKGQALALCVEKPVPAATYGYLRGKGFRATVMQDRQVIARILADDGHFVQAGTTDCSKFLIPQSGDDKLYLYVEAMDDGSIELAVREDDNGNG